MKSGSKQWLKFYPESQLILAILNLKIEKIVFFNSKKNNFVIKVSFLENIKVVCWGKLSSVILVSIVPKIDLIVYQCKLWRETKEGKSDGVTFICLRFDQYFGIKLDRPARYRKLGKPAYTQFSSTVPNSYCINLTDTNFVSY